MSGVRGLLRSFHRLVALGTVLSVLDFSAAVDYGKLCAHDDNCHDFRLVCLEGLCVCSRFYDWNSRYRACNLNVTELKHFLSTIAVNSDLETVEKLDQQAQSTFNRLGFAGIFALALGVFGSLGCVCLSCINDKRYHNRHKLTKEANSAPDKVVSVNPEAAASADPCFVPPSVIEALDIAV